MSGALSYMTLDGREVSNSARLAALGAAGLLPQTIGISQGACGVLIREASSAAGGAACPDLGFSDELAEQTYLNAATVPAYYNGPVGGPVANRNNTTPLSDGYFQGVGFVGQGIQTPISGDTWADGVVILAFEPVPASGVNLGTFSVVGHATGPDAIQSATFTPNVGDYYAYAQISGITLTTAQLKIGGQSADGQWSTQFAVLNGLTYPAAGRQWLVLRTAGAVITGEWWLSDPRVGGTPWQTVTYTLTTAVAFNGPGGTELQLYGQPGRQGLGSMSGLITNPNPVFAEWWATPACVNTCHLYPSPFLFPAPSLYPDSCGTPATLLSSTPWVDSSRPESNDFRGFYLDQIDGLDGDTSRSVDQRSGGLGGAALGPLVQMGRSIKVHGWLVAASCRGLDYGREWLNDILASSCRPCPDSVLRLRVAAPSPDDGTNDTQGLYYLYDVGLTDGPTISWISGDCDLAEVTFTLTAGNGFKYQAPINLLPKTTFASLNGSVTATVPPPPGIGTNGAIVTICAGSSDMLNVYPAAQLATYPADNLYPSDCLYPNNGGSPVTLPNTSCPAGFLIPRIPAGGCLQIDSARHRIIYTDAGGTVQDGTYLLSQDTARAIDWLESQACDQTHPDVVLVGASSYAADATVQIDYAHRER